MRGFFGGAGMNFFIEDEDKILYEKNKDKIKGEEDFILEFEIRGRKNPKCILHVVEDVEPGFLEEPGFHMWASSKRNKYEIFLSKERFEQVVYGYDPKCGGGFFISRSQFDRISFRDYKPLT